jgi:hypothetical protein
MEKQSGWFLNPMNEKVRDLHKLWNTVTGQNIPMGVCSYELEFGWHEFIKAGFTEADLLLVVRYLQAEIRKGDRKPAALRWRNCVGDVLRFAEEKELALGASKRKVPETPLSRAMSNLRPTLAAVTPDATRITARPVSELIENLKRSAGMTV